jgi:hypothetical protein
MEAAAGAARRVRARHRVAAVWAVPRSVSTAFERTFIGHPDVKVIHEPFTDCYYFSSRRCSARYGDEPSLAAFDGEAVTRSIEQASVSGPVLFKELCFQAWPYISYGFLDSIQNTFIVRDPRDVFSSLVELKPDFTEDEFGYKSLELVFDSALSLSREDPPLVIDGGVLQRRPQRIIEAFCGRIGVPFMPSQLRWESGRVRQWAPHEAWSQERWHATLERSHGIEPIVRPPKPIPRERQPLVDRAMRVYEKLTRYALL